MRKSPTSWHTFTRCRSSRNHCRRPQLRRATCTKKPTQEWIDGTHIRKEQRSQSGTIRKAVILIGLIWSKWRDCRCFVGDSHHPLCDVSATQERYGRRLVRPGSSRGFCLSHRADGKNHYAGASRRLAEHYVPDGGLCVTAGERTVPDTVAHLSASRLFCPLGGC